MTDNGIVTTRSNHSVDETVERLKSILTEKGITIFALIDHSGEAEKAGLQMRPTKLLIFGNPKGGTLVMLAAPSSAIDLPLKMLVWEASENHVLISFNRPDYLAQRHDIPPNLLANLAIVNSLAQFAAHERPQKLET